ncbi:MAG: TIGR00159 family protein [Candidatus Omnitrophica bacterium]|nr:TIGR00159 family protein [Candidatus Omnitrophota bacterium]
MEGLFLKIWKPAIEIIVLWFVFYRILLFIKNTRAVQVLKGLILLAIIFLIIQKLELDILNWILTKLFALSIFAFLIIFQPELRHALAKIGQDHIFGFFMKEEHIIDEIVNSVIELSKKKIGALIAIEREAGLKNYIETGTVIDSKVTGELLETIFMPNSLLHDGGVIIQSDRIAAAGCLFPLTQNQRISRALGTRHRAAIGLTEETDAVVLVVSEETGAISISLEGGLSRDLDKDALERILKELYKPKLPGKLIKKIPLRESLDEMAIK